VLELSLITKEVFNFLTKWTGFICLKNLLDLHFQHFCLHYFIVLYLLYFEFTLFTSPWLYHAVLRSIWLLQISTDLLTLFRIEEIRGHIGEEKRDKSLFLQCRPFGRTHCLISFENLMILNLRRLIAQRFFVQPAEI